MADKTEIQLWNGLIRFRHSNDFLQLSQLAFCDLKPKCSKLWQKPIYKPVPLRLSTSGELEGLDL